MARFVRRITLVTLDGPHQGESTTLYKKKRKKKKVSRYLRPLERAQRRLLKASDAFASESLGRHNRSNRKRRDGFLRDLGINQIKASRKAFKKLRIF